MAQCTRFCKSCPEGVIYPLSMSESKSSCSQKCYPHCFRVGINVESFLVLIFFNKMHWFVCPRFPPCACVRMCGLNLLPFSWLSNDAYFSFPTISISRHVVTIRGGAGDGAAVGRDFEADIKLGLVRAAGYGVIAASYCLKVERGSIYTNLRL